MPAEIGAATVRERLLTRAALFGAATVSTHRVEFLPRLHSGGLGGQDGILRAGWQPALGGHSQTPAGGLSTRRRLPTCPTSRHFPPLYFASLDRRPLAGCPAVEAPLPQRSQVLTLLLFPPRLRASAVNKQSVPSRDREGAI